MSIYGNIVGGNVADSIKQQVEYVGTFTTALPTEITENGHIRAIRKGDYVVASEGVTVAGYNIGDIAIYNGTAWNKIDGADYALVDHTHTIANITNLQNTLNSLATQTYVDNAIGAIPTPDVSGQITTHNTSVTAHSDIRDLVTGLTTRLNTLANSDDTTLDQLSEIVAYIKSNRSLIETITTNKVNVSDIIDNLTTNVAGKPLSAAQGVVLKGLIDAITVPTKVSDLTNDSGFITISDVPEGSAASTTTPLMDGVATAGTETAFARGNHVHPHDTSKVDVVTGKGLSTNDYTTAEREKLAGIAAGAEVNVNADWNANSGDAQILNKPTIPTTLKNPNALTFGSKTYDGSTAKTIVASDLGALTAHQDITGKQDKLTGTAGQVVGFDTNGNAIAQAAPISGEMNVQSDWNAVSGDALILNKPSIPSKTSDLANDSGFITVADIPESPVASVVSTHNTAENAHAALFAAKANPSTGFTVTLTAAGWSNLTQTVSDARLLTSECSYIVAPAADYNSYTAAMIHAENVTTAGQMTFVCTEAPTENITVNILKIEVSA